MKLGLDLQTLNEEIHRRVALKRDFIAPIPRISMLLPALVNNGKGRMIRPAPQLHLSSIHENIPDFEILPTAHNQLIELTKINGDYYRSIQSEDPELLVINVNRRLARVSEKRRTMRTLDGKCRALLSDGYRILENEDLLDAMLPVLVDLDLLILSCQITETRLYIKAVDKKIIAAVPTGAKLGEGHVRMDSVSPTITISNSEVGMGGVRVEGGRYTYECTNMASFGPCMHKYHTGARADVSDDVYALLSDDTKKLTDAAVWAQARDLVKAVFDKVRFEEENQKLIVAVDDKLDEDVVEVVKKVAKRYTFSEGERKSVLNHLIQGADLTRYGLHAAITRTAEDLPDYDRATRFERLGGEIIELSRPEWQKLAT